MTTADLNDAVNLVPDLTDHPQIVIIGLGGVGAIVARYAGAFIDRLDEQHRIRLVDGDSYEVTNLDRQIFRDYGNKAVCVQHDLEDNQVIEGTDITAIEEFVGEENAERILTDGALIFLCVDHHGVRKFVSDWCCEHLQDFVLISGGNHGIDPDAGEYGTYGNVQVHVRQHGQDLTPPITQYHREIAEADLDDAPLGQQGCAAMAASVPQLMFANLAVASQMCSALVAYACSELRWAEVAFDIFEGRCNPVLPAPRGDTK